MAANATAGGGPEAIGRMPEILGRQAAAGEGTESRIFRRDGIVGSGRGRSPGQIIHLIAIGKRQPGHDGDARAEGPARAPTKTVSGRDRALRRPDSSPGAFPSRDGSSRRRPQNDSTGWQKPAIRYRSPTPAPSTGCGRETSTGRIASVDGAKRENWSGSAKTAAKSDGATRTHSPTRHDMRTTRAPVVTHQHQLNAPKPIPHRGIMSGTLPAVQLRR
jgi:hypothetical protein